MTDGVDIQEAAKSREIGTVFRVERVRRVEDSVVVVDARLLDVSVGPVPFHRRVVEVSGPDPIRAELAFRLREEAAHAVEVVRVENEAF